MNTLLKKLLLRTRVCQIAVFLPTIVTSQVNYITNGSFEHTYTCSVNNLALGNIVGWNSVDSTGMAPAGHYVNYCQSNGCCTVPLNNFGYQYPRTGVAHVLTQLFCPSCGIQRGYLKNRLKKELKANSRYCARIFLNSVHACLYSIDAVGMYFGGLEVDTFSNPNSAMPNIIPQIELSSILFDTLNWVPLTGTFVASGNEKYLIIGCFKSNATVNYSITNSSWPAWAGYNVDDVSCIELDENFAGPDTTILPGDSLFLGKTNDDDWLEAKFTWYKQPGAAAIDSTTGFWLKPVVTGTYVVKQEICNYTIWDTIVVKIKEDDVAVAKHRADFLKVYPVPAKDKLQLKTVAPEWYEALSFFTIINSLGQTVGEGHIDLSEGSFEIDVASLPQGGYTLILSGKEKEKVVKRILIMD